MDTEYLKQVATNVLIVIVSAVLIVFAVYHIERGFAEGIETEPALLDDFAEALSVDAYILRSEQVLYSGTDGVINYLVGDGEKVAKGDEVADIYRSGSAGIRERIAAIDEKIAALERVENSAKYLSVSDVSNIDATIAALVRSASLEMSKNSFSAVGSISDELLYRMNLRQLLTGEKESFEGELASLRAQREAAVAELTDVSETVKTNVSAYYFYDGDGYESAFDFSDISALSYSDVDAMMSAQPEVLSGKEAGKLVLDYTWYVLLPTDSDTAAYFTEGDSYDIDFSASGTTVKMKLERVIHDTDRTSRAACLLFSSRVMPEGFDYTRMQPVSVDVKTYEGYRLPLSAVRLVDYGGEPVEGVYILYGNTVRFRRVEIVLSQDGYVLCRPSEESADAEDTDYVFPWVGDTEPDETEAPETEAWEAIPMLELYDLVIVSSKELYDGKIIID